jgi:hypothetical protein
MKVITLFLLMAVYGMSSYAQTDSMTTNQKVVPWFVERFRISTGFFVPVTNTQIRVGLQGSVEGTEIDFNKDLGYNEGQMTFAAGLQWRISRRSRLSFNYYNIPRNSTHTLTKDIVFKDSTYPVNSTVKTFFNTAIYQISYGYAILSKPKYELGVMIGTHLIGGKVGFSVTGNNVAITKNNDFGFTAPLPDLGIWGGYAFSNRFAVNLDADYLALTIGDYTGSIFAYNLLFIYKLADHFDLSLGFSGLNCKLDVVKRGVEGNFKWGYNGPALGVSYWFGKKTWTH